MAPKTGRNADRGYNSNDRCPVVYIFIEKAGLIFFTANGEKGEYKN
jgi:hypothetical protein